MSSLSVQTSGRRRASWQNQVCGRRHHPWPPLRRLPWSPRTYSAKRPRVVLEVLAHEAGDEAAACGHSLAGGATSAGERLPRRPLLAIRASTAHRGIRRPHPGRPAAATARRRRRSTPSSRAPLSTGGAASRPMCQLAWRSGCSEGAAQAHEQRRPCGRRATKGAAGERLARRSSRCEQARSSAARHRAWRVPGVAIWPACSERRAAE